MLWISGVYEKLTVLRFLMDKIKEKLNIAFYAYGHLSSKPGIKTRKLLSSDEFKSICEIIKECGYTTNGWKLIKEYDYVTSTNYFVIYIANKITFYSSK